MEEKQATAGEFIKIMDFFFAFKLIMENNK